MFLNIIKKFILKNKVRRLLLNVTANQSKGIIKSVGVIFDGNYSIEIDVLVSELLKNGLEESQINVLIFKDKSNKNDKYNYDVFTYKDINWSAEILNFKANLFLNSNFDLLISYHNFEKAPLVYSSYLSKASFKVGFTTAQDKKLNQLMINTSPNNCQLFIDELFKYLSILNKI